MGSTQSKLMDAYTVDFSKSGALLRKTESARRNVCQLRLTYLLISDEIGHLTYTRIGVETTDILHTVQQDAEIRMDEIWQAYEDAFEHADVCLKEFMNAAVCEYIDPDTTRLVLAYKG